MVIERGIVHREGAFTLTVKDGEAEGVDIDIGKHEYIYSLSGPGVAQWTGREEGTIRGIRLETWDDDGSAKFEGTYERLQEEGRFVE